VLAGRAGERDRGGSSALGRHAPAGVTTAARPKLDELLKDVRRALAPAERAIRSHRYLDALTAGRVPEGSLRAFAGEQF